jgi:hypothetical protein
MTARDILYGRRGGGWKDDNGEPRHECHAQGCTTSVPPRLLMCSRHWRMVPKPMQDAIWATYEPGQEIRKDPTTDYLRAAQAAINHVAERERTTRPVDAQPELF